MFPPAIQFYQPMAQKLKVAKSIKNIDAYSKNPIIDSLIKQKLQSEMKSVKDNFQHMIKQSQEKIKPHHIRPLRKRTLSVQDLSTLQPQKIRSSLHYNPAAANQTIAFLTQRQTGSPFFQNSQIQELNRARTHNQQFFVRLNQSDRLNLQQLPNKDPAFYQSLQGKAKQKLPSDLWLPSLPEVDNIVTSRVQRLQEGQISQSKLFNIETTGRPSSDGFNPLRSHRAQSSREGQKDSNGPEITYEHKKYHKGDYQSLEKWLEIAVDFINAEARKEQSTDQSRPKEHLNQIYTIYMCAIRQLIRLTYIQSGEKGLILEKVVWSMVRLFEELLREQHKLNFGDFKYFSSQIEQERQMYTERMRKLERKVQEQEEIVTEYLESKRKIVLTGFSFKKVNQEMHRQIHTLLEQVRNLNKQNDFLMQNLLKLIHEFQSRDQIKLQKTEEHNVYFYLNDKNKPEVVARVPTHEDLQRHFQQEMKRNVIKDQHFEGKNHVVGKLDNELTSYWERKMMYLDVHGIVQEHFSCDVQDVGIHVDGKGPTQFMDMAVQHPEKEQESFQNFLKKQLEEEREYWERKEGEYVQSQITLKDLYNQMKGSIDILTSQNVGLRNQIEPKDHEINFQNKKIEQLQGRVDLFTKKIQMLQSTIDRHIDQEKKFIEQIKDLKEKLADQKKQYLFQKQNNNLLASSLFEIKDKNERIAKQFEDLQQKIKAVAPHLQEVMSLPEASQHLTLINLAAVVDRNLSEYVERDAKVFLTH